MLIALILLFALGIGIPSLISNRSGSDAPSSTTIDTTGMPAEGSADARVALVEFSDYECPYCARFTTTTLPSLRTQYISTGKVRHFFANFPLPNHGNAKALAAAAVCAGEQDAYWKMHDALFDVKPRTAEAVMSTGTSLGLQMTPFATCLQNDREFNERLGTDQRIASGFEISGTPSFVLGSLDAKGQVVAADLIQGAHPLPVFEKAITQLLAK